MNVYLKSALSLLILVACVQSLSANDSQKEEITMMPKMSHDCNTASKPLKAPSHSNFPVYVYFDSSVSILEFSTTISGLLTYYIYNMDNTLIQTSIIYSSADNSNFISISSLPDGEYILNISFADQEYIGYLSK